MRAIETAKSFMIDPFVHTSLLMNRLIYFLEIGREILNM
jgi:hypothetical protein